ERETRQLSQRQCRCPRNHCLSRRCHESAIRRLRRPFECPDREGLTRQCPLRDGQVSQRWRAVAPSPPLRREPGFAGGVEEPRDGAQPRSSCLPPYSRNRICRLLSKALSQRDFHRAAGKFGRAKLLILLVQLGGFEPPTS